MGSEFVSVRREDLEGLADMLLRVQEAAQDQGLEDQMTDALGLLEGYGVYPNVDDAVDDDCDDTPLAVDDDEFGSIGAEYRTWRHAPPGDIHD